MVWPGHPTQKPSAMGSPSKNIRDLAPSVTQALSSFNPSPVWTPYQTASLFNCRILAPIMYRLRTDCLPSSLTQLVDAHLLCPFKHNRMFSFPKSISLMPITEGGLGITNLKAASHAMRAQLAIRALQQPDSFLLSLLGFWLRPLLLPHCPPNTLAITTPPPSPWPKLLLEIREALSSALMEFPDLVSKPPNFTRLYLFFNTR